MVPKVNNFRSACTKGGINVYEQREIFREQARIYFKLSHEDQELTELEDEEHEQFEAELEKTRKSNEAVKNNKVVVNNNIQ